MWLAAPPLNHVLAQNPWATRRLAPLAGKTFALRAFPLPALAFTILADGHVQAALPGVPADATLSATPDALLRYLAIVPHDPGLIRIGGEQPLGEALREVLANIAWEAEEDLSRLFGDIAAHRLGKFARQWIDGRKHTAWSIAATVSEYVAEERALIGGRGALTQFAADVARTRDAVDALERRIQRLMP